MKIIILLAALVFSVNAYAAPNICYSTHQEIKKIYPDDRPKYTHYMKNHRDEKCWYAASLGFDHDDKPPRPKKKAQVVKTITPTIATPTTTGSARAEAAPKEIYQPDSSNPIVKMLSWDHPEEEKLTGPEMVTRAFAIGGWK